MADSTDPTQNPEATNPESTTPAKNPTPMSPPPVTEPTPAPPMPPASDPAPTPAPTDPPIPSVAPTPPPVDPPIPAPVDTPAVPEVISESSPQPPAPWQPKSPAPPTVAEEQSGSGLTAEEVGPPWLRTNQGSQASDEGNLSPAASLGSAPPPWQTPAERAGETAALEEDHKEGGFPVIIFVILILGIVVAIVAFLFTQGALPFAR